MGNGYTRQAEAEISDGETIFADPIEDEFDAIQAAFNSSTGHSHDGTAGEGPKIDLTTSVQGILPKANGGSGTNTDSLVTSGGSATAFTVTANEAFVSLTSGKQVFFRAHTSNTGAATINVNGLGAKDAVKFAPTVGELALTANDIIEDNVYLITYDSTLDGGNGAWNVMNVAGVNHTHDGTDGQGPQIDLTDAVTGVLPVVNGGTGASSTSLVTSGGTANALTITANEPFAALSAGKEVTFKASLSNTGAATVNVNSLGIKKIRKFIPDTGETDISSQDIVQGGTYRIVYNTSLDGGLGAWQLFTYSGVLQRITPTAQTNLTIQQLSGNFSALNLNSILGVTRGALYWDSTDGTVKLAVYNSSGVLIGDPLEFDGNTLSLGSWNTDLRDSYALIKNQVATPITHAAALTENAWTTWPLTGEEYDDDGIVTVASNQFVCTMDAMVRWDATATGAASTSGSNSFDLRTRLYNVTDAVVAGLGTVIAYASVDSQTLPLWSNGECKITAGKTYAVQYYCTTTNGAAIASFYADDGPGWGDQINLRVKIHAQS